MKYLLTIYLILASTRLYSVDCGELHSGETIRIDQAGGSLEHFRHQDQDGLGICYATATSAQMQSVLPNHPEISYFQLASIVGTNKIEKKLLEDSTASDLFVKKKILPTHQDGTTDEDGKWTFAITNGTTCETIAQAQAKQRKNDKAILCPKNKTNIEELIAKNGDPDHMELKIFLESAKYMNFFHDAFSDSKEKEKYANFSRSFEDLIANKRQQLENSTCKLIYAGGIESVLHGALALSLTYRDCFGLNFSRRNEYWCKMVRTIAPDAKQKNSYTIVAKQIGAPLLSRLKKTFEKSDKTFSLAQIRNDFRNDLIAEAKVQTYELPEANDFGAELANSLSDEKLQNLINEYNEIKSSGSSKKCVERLMIDYLASDKFEHDYLNSEILCKNQALMRQASAVVIEYSHSGLKDLNTVFTFLQKSAGLSYHDAMMSLNASDCTDQDKITIPNELKCETHAVSPETKNLTDAIILKNLKNNKSVSIGFCSEILEKPKSSFAPGECGNHAVNITGLSCLDGKYKYLIQNSWGIDYVAANPAIKTEEGRDAHWLDERSYDDSVYGITTLDLEK